MKKILKIIGYTVVAVPLLVLLLIGAWVYDDISQSNKLQSICDTARIDIEVETILRNATKDYFTVRTGGLKGKDDKEWFDREYLRLGIYLEKAKNITDDYSIVFAKPGLGYYACIVVHKDGLVKSAWFEDRSS